MRKIKRFLTLALATVIAVSSLTITSKAASRADENRHDLTAAQIATISTIFDASYYAKAYPDVVDTLGTSDAATLFNHFISFGIWEERQPSAKFNVDVYASRNADLQEKYGSDIIGYYVNYVTNLKTDTWRVTPTLNDAYAKGATIYSVYDFVQGQKGVKAGAVPVQTPTYAPALGIGVK